MLLLCRVPWVRLTPMFTKVRWLVMLVWMVGVRLLTLVAKIRALTLYTEAVTLVVPVVTPQINTLKVSRVLGLLVVVSLLMPW